MSPLVKMLSACSVVAILGLGLLALTNSAQAHPHEKTASKKAKLEKLENENTERKIQKKIIIKRGARSDDDLNEHFEEHAKSLREAIGKMKTESRIIAKQIQKSGKTSDDAKTTRKVTKRIKIIENPDELRSAARSIENLLADSGLLQSLADVVIEIAEDIEIEDSGDGMHLSFNGNSIGGFSMDENNHSLTIDSLGKSTTIEKETFIENGKTKTRIIIETDSDDIDFDVIEKEDKRRRKSGF